MCTENGATLNYAKDICSCQKRKKKNRGSYKEILREQRGHKTIYIYIYISKKLWKVERQLWYIRKQGTKKILKLIKDIVKKVPEISRKKI